MRLRDVDLNEDTTTGAMAAVMVEMTEGTVETIVGVATTVIVMLPPLILAMMTGVLADMTIGRDTKNVPATIVLLGMTGNMIGHHEMNVLVTDWQMVSPGASMVDISHDALICVSLKQPLHSSNKRQASG